MTLEDVNLSDIGAMMRDLQLSWWLLDYEDAKKRLIAFEKQYEKQLMFAESLWKDIYRYRRETGKEFNLITLLDRLEYRDIRYIEEAGIEVDVAYFFIPLLRVLQRYQSLKEYSGEVKSDYYYTGVYEKGGSRIRYAFLTKGTRQFELRGFHENMRYDHRKLDKNLKKNFADIRECTMSPFSRPSSFLTWTGIAICPFSLSVATP
jgi:uncharacterized protein YkuJ